MAAERSCALVEEERRSRRERCTFFFAAVAKERREAFAKRKLPQQIVSSLGVKEERGGGGDLLPCVRGHRLEPAKGSIEPCHRPFRQFFDTLMGYLHASTERTWMTQCQRSTAHFDKFCGTLSKGLFQCQRSTAQRQQAENIVDDTD